MKNENLADKITNPIESISSSLVDTYSEKGIGYIKLLAITGSALPIILALSNEKIGIIAMLLSFILILLAMKKVDNISTNTKSYRYMIISFIAYIIFSFVYIYSLTAAMSSWNFSTEKLFSRYLFQTITVAIMAFLSTYYYKSYIELSKATRLNIFKIAAIMMIVSMFTVIISDTLSSLLIIVSAIFTLIGWISIKEIGSIQKEEDEIKKQ